MSPRVHFCRPVLAIGAALLLVVSTLTAGAGPADASDRENVLAMRLADLEAQGRCDEAVAAYHGSGFDNARMALIVGRCQVRTRDYNGAVETLTVAREMPDAPADVDLQLAVAQYHQGDLAASRASLDRARARGSEGAMLELYTGLLQLQADDARNAANSLERARRADAQAVEPVASYYAFLAWRSVEEEERAQAALERLRESDPDGPWIAEAERVLAGGARSDETPNFWLIAEAGLEYDSNVIVKGDVPEVFINGKRVGDEDDGRGVWSIEAGSELFRTDRWSGGVLGFYSGNAHFEINEFDTHYPAAAAWVDYFAAERTTLRARYDYGFAWVDYDPYLSGHTLTGTVFQSWEEHGFTELSLIAGFHDFKYDREDPDGPPGPLDEDDIDRDATQLSAELLHRYPTGFEDLEVRGGYRYSWNEAEGREFDYMAHRFFAGFEMTLPFEVEWDTLAAFTYRPFERTSVYNTSDDPDHEDRQWDVATELEKFVTDNVSVLARYRFTDSGSNTGEYDYDRHIVGGYVRIYFR